MATTIKTEVRLSYFYVQIEGDFDFLQSMFRLPQVMTEFARSGRKQILMDARKVLGEVTVLQRMDYYSNFTKLLREVEHQRLNKQIRVAWLVPPHWLGAGPGSELVEMAGYELIRTDDPKEILDWLKADPKTEGL
jgi:hypothetical protein